MAVKREREERNRVSSLGENHTREYRGFFKKFQASRTDHSLPLSPCKTAFPFVRISHKVPTLQFSTSRFIAAMLHVPLYHAYYSCPVKIKLTPCHDTRSVKAPHFRFYIGKTFSRVSRCVFPV